MVRKIFEKDLELTQYHPWNYTVVTKNCVKCGEEYKTISGKAKYCEACRYPWKYKYVKKNKEDFKYKEAEVWLYAEPKTIKCKSCGKYFATKIRTKRYCSEVCRKNRDNILKELTKRFENE